MRLRSINIVFITLSAWWTQAHGQSTALLEIKVIKRAYGEDTTKPFSGIGVFDLLRGRSKLEGASCPDRSGASGAINCSLPCDKKHTQSITIRIQPPSNQDHLTGWITPSAQDVELQGCKLSPKFVIMKYDDARYALNEVLVNKYVVSSNPPAKTSSIWIRAFTVDPAVAEKVAIEAKTTAEGRSDLLDIYRFANEGSKSYKTLTGKLSTQEAEESAVLKRWQILSTSALLGAKFEKVIPADQRGSVKFLTTSDATSYLAGLKQADLVLGEIKHKTSEQLKLSDDIKTLRAIGVTSRDSQDTLSIIEQWR
jgi:hypothetical protein